jgi:hypothetical protein
MLEKDRKRFEAIKDRQSEVCLDLRAKDAKIKAEIKIVQVSRGSAGQTCFHVIFCLKKGFYHVE